MTDDALHGVRVVVLRAGGAADLVRAELAAWGATAHTVRTADVSDRPDEELKKAVGVLARYRWVAVTSANAARRLALWSRAWPASTRIAAVGPATQRAVEWVGLSCDAVASDGTAASLADEIDLGPVLFVAAASAREDLAAALERRGVDVTTVVAYDVLLRALDAADEGVLLDADVLVAMSPTAIDAIEHLADEPRSALHGVPLVTIGPTTTAHARALSWHTATQATRRDTISICEAVVRAAHV